MSKEIQGEVGKEFGADSTDLITILRTEIAQLKAANAAMERVVEAAKRLDHAIEGQQFDAHYWGAVQCLNHALAALVNTGRDEHE